ncbi:MAG: class I SAM-dependent methyltransferase [Verrucomicrobiota bacterium]
MNARDLLRPAKRCAEEIYFRATGSLKLTGRYQLPSLLNARALLGTGVEVGVFEGSFSNYLLTHWRGQKLISVDPWRMFGPEYEDMCNREQTEMDRLFERTKTLLSAHGPRSEVWRMTGVEAAAKIKDGSLDFVYIDAQHHEEAVAEDVRQWFPKLRPGGLLAGHDYLDGEFSYGRFGVKTAVDRFIKEQGLSLHVTTGEASPTWFCFRT